MSETNFSKLRIFGAFEKFDKQEDGSVIVSGTASSDALDSDGEKISPDAMREAIPAWMKFGNIRQMHQPSAAGVALSCEVDASGKTNLVAKIVDDQAARKVTSGTYKGFSVAGETLSKVGNLITRLRLHEISLVDRPANPESVFDCWKLDKPSEQKKTMIDQKFIAKALGLAEDSTEEQVSTELAKRLKPVVPPAPTPPPAPEPNAELISKISMLTEAVNKLQTSGAEAIKKAEKSERDSIVADASREGKVIPLSPEEIEQTPVAILKNMVSKLEKTVPLGKMQKAAKPPTADERKVMLETGRARGVDQLNEFFAKQMNPTN